MTRMSSMPPSLAAADERLLPLRLRDADRDAPPPWLDELMRDCYPTEREMEAILGRKLAHRAQAAGKPPGLEDLTGHLTAFLGDKVDGPFEIRDQRWFAGGA